MFCTAIFVILATFSLSFASILQTRDGLTANNLEQILFGAALSYHALGENIRLTGSSGHDGTHVLSAYDTILGDWEALPIPKGRTLFPKEVQLALCDAETTAVLQMLEVLTLLKLNKKAFTSSEISAIASLIKKDMDEDKVFAPSLVPYVPECAGVIGTNGNATQTSFAAAWEDYGS
ncbi:hypothetical protein EJ08DRAFT_729802 [Tothia fuscella]|uniref:Uncharacterized protein n=1 Tax=Tothia fuscella TaxID=1048955 RepID=A0A9P4P1Z6_9PEZI|nr:hypothetical protein EJ08DRAFT_729802 [Tothia fuscella]